MLGNELKCLYKCVFFWVGWGGFGVDDKAAGS